MRVNRLQLALAIAIVLLSLLEWVDAYPSLPDPMATNFGEDGAPGGWSPKQSFFILHIVSSAFWLGGVVAAPWIAERGGRSFDPTNRMWLRDTVGWFLLASLAFSALVTHWVLEANLVTGKLSGGFVWALAVYLMYVSWWTLRLVKRRRGARSASTRAK